MRLSRLQKAYVKKLWEELREANLMVRRFDAEWHEMNNALNQRYQNEDPVQVAKAKEVNLALQDAFSAGKWWMEKAQWLSAAIQAEKAALELLNDMVGGASCECHRHSVSGL